MSTEGQRFIKVGKRRIRIPRSRALRMALAFGLLVRAIIPPPHGLVLVIPALTLLSVDFSRARRWRRRLVVKFGRRGQGNVRHKPL